MCEWVGGGGGKWFWEEVVESGLDYSYEVCGVGVVDAGPN